MTITSYSSAAPSRKSRGMLLFQKTAVGHGDTAGNGTYDTDKPLVRATEVQVFNACCAVDALLRRSVNRAVFVPGETLDRPGSKHVCFDHVRPEIGDVARGGGYHAIVPVLFG